MTLTELGFLGFGTELFSAGFSNLRAGLFRVGLLRKLFFFSCFGVD